jgi:hypothetical protein
MGYPFLTMKKAAAGLAIVLTLLAASGQVLAQSSIVSQVAGDKAASDKLYFGLKFGVSCSQLKGLGYGDRLGGFHLGLMAHVLVESAPGRCALLAQGATESLCRPATRRSILLRHSRNRPSSWTTSKSPSASCTGWAASKSAAVRSSGSSSATEVEADGLAEAPQR